MGAYPPVVEDSATRVVWIAAELGSDNVAAVARRAGASLSYTYRVLHAGPADAIEQAKMNGARVRERLLNAKQAA